MKSLSRRTFLKTAAVTATGATFIPNLLSCSPNNKLNIAVIGVGGRGQANWEKVTNENIVAMCDVDYSRASVGFNSIPKTKKFKDFRKMFDEIGKGIDAVILSTPDHTHFPAAMEMGKHVYVPKSWRGFFDFGNGMLGDWACHTLDAPFRALNLGMPHTVETISSNPSPDYSFISDTSKVTFQFGQRDNKVPMKLTWYEGGEQPGIRPEWKVSKLPESGMIMIGEKKSLITGGRPNNPCLMVPDDEWNDFLENAPEKTIPRTLEEQPQQEWINCIKENTLPGSNFNYSADLIEMILIGVLSQRFQTKLEYDSDSWKILNRPDLNTYLKEPVREGWIYGENL